VNFFTVPLRLDSALLAPPIVRPVVTTLKPTLGEHILVYSTTGKDEKNLQTVLSKFGDSKFYIYGFNKGDVHENCVFKERSTEGFLKDLASARGVIASAGFSLLSECMYLKKKMLLLPVAGQYEQIINAHYIQKLGLGIWSKRLDETAVGRFLEELDKSVPSDERILWPDNDRFFHILQGVLNKLRKPISIGVS
jgi:uncharacterized protein (TIGR00661 family)